MRLQTWQAGYITQKFDGEWVYIITISYGKNITSLGITNGDTASESMYEDEGERSIMEGRHEMVKQFREYEFGRK